MSIPTTEQKAVFAAKFKLQSAVQRMKQSKVLIMEAEKDLESVNILDFDLPALHEHIETFIDSIEAIEQHLKKVYA
ncbi:MAG: hypothetical protein PVH19_00125 [Planctomycetia bacterium]